MKRRFVSALLAAILGVLLTVTPSAAKAGASIAAQSGPFVYGGFYLTYDVVNPEWTGKNGKQPDGGYWARVDCYQGTYLVYAQYANLQYISNSDGFTFGPTPLWQGGGATCTLRLDAIDNGADHYLASDSFIVGP